MPTEMIENTMRKCHKNNNENNREYYKNDKETPQK